jgi:hypothetical protein
LELLAALSLPFSRAGNFLVLIILSGALLTHYSDGERVPVPLIGFLFAVNVLHAVIRPKRKGAQ